MAKVRVHELAKQYDVTSKEVLGMLSELGEFVTAASSTVEPPVVKRFQEKYGAELSRSRRQSIAARSRAEPSPFDHLAADAADAVAHSAA